MKKTHCKNGHEFTPENTYVAAKGHRVCRACACIGQQKHRAKYPEQSAEYHRNETRVARMNTKEELVRYKGGVCVDCQEPHPLCCIQFHHLDPMQKVFGITGKLYKPLEELKLEADKCVLLCANCHAIRTEGDYEVGKKIRKRIKEKTYGDMLSV
jgi:hypothetical protein